MKSRKVKKVLEPNISVLFDFWRAKFIFGVKKDVKSYDESSYYQFEIELCKYFAYS